MSQDLKALTVALERNASDICPSCGGTKWADFGTRVLLQYVDPNEPMPTGHGLPVIPMGCLHCGFIRLHSTLILEEQLDS